MRHKCLGLGEAPIRLQALRMDPCLVPSFRPVAAAIDGIRIFCHVNVTVPDRMNLFCVHDMAFQLVAVRKNGSE